MQSEPELGMFPDVMQRRQGPLIPTVCSLSRVFWDVKKRVGGGVGGVGGRWGGGEEGLWDFGL